jgi:hypothetical protein
MRYCVFPLVWLMMVGLGAGQGSAQQQPQYSVTRNGDGSQVVASSAGASSTIERLIPGMNGRMVPWERVEERVVSKDATSTVTEQVIRRFDMDGRPTEPDRIRTEERLNPDGSTTRVSTVYRSDVNGASQLAERSVTTTRVSGNRTAELTTVERPSVSGTLEISERREATTEKRSGGLSEKDVVVYRPTLNGSLAAALRETVERREANGKVTEDLAQFQPGATGAMQLINQTVTRSAKAADGSVTTEVDLYTTALPGRPLEANARPRLREQQVIERRRISGQASAVRETVSVRRPSPDDPARLAGPPQVISESVCQGACKP